MNSSTLSEYKRFSSQINVYFTVEEEYGIPTFYNGRILTSKLKTYVYI